MSDSFDDYALSLSPWMYLRLDDTSGTSAVDASGNSQTGTYVNSPTLNQNPISFDQAGRSVLFNGADQYITVPYHANFDSAAFTVIALVNIASLSAYACVFQHGDNTSGGNQGYYILVNTSGQIHFMTLVGSWQSVTTTTGVIVTKKPTFIAISYTNSAVTVYKNGYVHETLTWSPGSKSTSNSTVKIAVLKDSYLTGYFNGSMSRVLYFTSALTAEQIKTLYEKMITSYRGAPLDARRPLVKPMFTPFGR